MKKACKIAGEDILLDGEKIASLDEVPEYFRILIVLDRIDKVWVEWDENGKVQLNGKIIITRIR